MSVNNCLGKKRNFTYVFKQVFLLLITSSVVLLGRRLLCNCILRRTSTSADFVPEHLNWTTNGMGLVGTIPTLEIFKSVVRASESSCSIVIVYCIWGGIKMWVVSKR